MNDKSWKVQMSALVNEGHDCNIMSLFLNSKLFQKLVCIGMPPSGSEHTTANETLYDISVDEEINAPPSLRSSGTETMEYEDIDRLMFSIDSTSLAKDMIDDISVNGRDQIGQLESGLENEDYGNYHAASPHQQPIVSQTSANGFKVMPKKATRIVKRKYTKRKKVNPEDVLTDTKKNEVSLKSKKKILLIVGSSTCFKVCCCYIVYYYLMFSFNVSERFLNMMSIYRNI